MFSPKGDNTLTRYFMRDTPLQGMEQQMMLPPNDKPRGHGFYHSKFRYKPGHVECQYCMKYTRRCECLEERIEAGALDLNELIRECFCSALGPPLQARLQEYINQNHISFFRNDEHWKRWTHWRNRYYRMSDKDKVALFLLTSHEELWRRVIWKFSNDGFDFQSVRLSGIPIELYSIYQAAKAIAIGSRNITTADLASHELVTDEAFRLIICALLLTKYGDVILDLEGKKGDIKQ